jgi:hypothetical protein
MYKNVISNFLNNNPASLSTNLLLMGDRTASDVVPDPYPPPFWKRTNMFDQRFGAGRLRMRMPNAAGLDYPSWYFNGWTCIDHQEVYTYTLNGGNALSEDMDTLKAVVWWYDRRHETGTQIDNIDLVLKETNGNVLRSSASPYDNKERVYYYDIGGKAVKLEISGTSVTADDEGCGTNSMKVYFVVMAEDADRDDPDGLPSYSPTTCVGVEPEL